MKKIKPSEFIELSKTFGWLIATCFRVSPIHSALQLLLSAVQIAANVLSYYAAAKVSAELVRAITTSGDTVQLWKWFVVIIVTSFVANGSFRLNKVIERYIYYSVSHWATLGYAKHLSTIDMKDFYDPEVRNEINRINSGFTWQVPNSATYSLSMIQSVANMLVTIVAIGVLVWWIIPLFIVLLLPVFIYEAKVAKIGWFVWDDQGDNQHIFWGLMSTFQQAKKQFEIRALTASKRLHDIANSLLSGFYKQQEKELRKYNLLAFFTILLQVVREGGSQAWLLVQAINRTISIDQYFFYVSMIFRLDGAIAGVFSGLANMQDGLKFSQDYRRFLAKSPTIVDIVDAITVGPEVPSIQFIDATFTYPGSEHPVFTKLNLTIGAGEKTALVGENGAGKSTVVKLLMRFYRLDSGKLLINGTNIDDIVIDSWLKQIAVLFQDFNEYPLSVKDNISISGEEVSHELVIQSAKLSGAHDFIQKLPHKYNTYLDPAFKNGAEPSGGQWQRIALARAFYRKANCIILDEPTAAIDAKAEYEIFNNIFTEHDGKTALIISHRFSTVRKADTIIVLDKGKVVEKGSHAELLKQHGLYAEMFDKQAEGYR